MTTKKTLDDIEGSLSPADAVYALYQPVLQAKTLTSAVEAMMALNGSAPDGFAARMRALKQQVQRAREQATRGLPKAERERLITASWQEALFLHRLLATIEGEEWAAIPFRQMLVYLMPNAGGIFCDDDCLAKTNPLFRAGTPPIKRYLAPGLRLIWLRPRVLDALSARFFGGRPIISPVSRTFLDAAHWSVEFFLGTYELEFGEPLFTGDEDAEVAQEAQRIMDQARQGLWIQFGPKEAAYKSLREAHDAVVKEEPS